MLEEPLIQKLPLQVFHFLTSPTQLTLGIDLLLKSFKFSSQICLHFKLSKRYLELSTGWEILLDPGCGRLHWPKLHERLLIGGLLSVCSASVSWYYIPEFSELGS
jgi:hypothetical protein